MTWLFLQAVVSGLLLGGVYGLVASGLSLIFGVLRIINFAHGAVMMLGMYTSYWLFVLLGVDPYLSILVTGPLFFGLGMLIQRIIIEPNRAAAEHNQLLLTLGVALFLENLALVLWQGDYRTVRVWYSGASFLVADVLVEVPRLVAAAGAVLIALALWGFLRTTDAGKAIRALSEEPEGARLVGIDVARIRGVAFGIGSACVAVAGALVTPFFYVAPDVGESFNIMAFVVVVLGGMGNFLGALVGGFIVGLGRAGGRPRSWTSWAWVRAATCPPATSPCPTASASRSPAGLPPSPGCSSWMRSCPGSTPPRSRPSSGSSAASTRAA